MIPKIRFVSRIPLCYDSSMNKIKSWFSKSNTKTAKDSVNGSFDAKGATNRIFEKYHKTFKDLALYDKGEKTISR